MPKKKVSASAGARTSDAAALIAAAQRRHELPDPPPAALAELRKVLAYNDAASPRKRVPITAAAELCRSLGWAGTGRTLNGVCQRVLGRRSYGTP